MSIGSSEAERPVTVQSPQSKRSQPDRAVVRGLRSASEGSRDGARASRHAHRVGTLAVPRPAPASSRALWAAAFALGLSACSLASSPTRSSSSSSRISNRLDGGASNVSRLLGTAGAGRRPDAGPLARLQSSQAGAGAPAALPPDALELDAGEAPSAPQDAGTDARPAQALDAGAGAHNDCGGLSVLPHAVRSFCSVLTGCLRDGGFPPNCAPAPRWQCQGPESLECLCQCE